MLTKNTLQEEGSQWKPNHVMTHLTVNVDYLESDDQSEEDE